MEGSIPKPLIELLRDKQRMSLVRTAMVSVNNAASALVSLPVLVQPLSVEYDDPNKFMVPVQDVVARVVELMKLVEQLN